MTIQSYTELRALNALGQVAAEIRDTIAQAAVPGVTTKYLDALAVALAIPYEAQSAPQIEYGFPGFLCISVNDAIVHGIPNSRILLRGDVVTIDVTIGRGGLVADTARTVVVGGTSRLVTTTAAALTAGIAAFRVGALLSCVGVSISGAVQDAGFHVVRELCGHGVGRQIHEFPPVYNYPELQDDVVVWDGLVVAIEPITSVRPTAIYKDSDGWTIRTAGCNAAHFEHTVVATKYGSVVIT